MTFLSLLLSCGGKTALLDTSDTGSTDTGETIDSGVDTSDTSTTTEEYTEATYIPLDPVTALNRVSMALRGIKPAPQEIELVQNDPDQLYTLAEQYTQSAAFVETMGDMYAEVLQMRSITLNLPERGELEDHTRQEIRWALGEEPINIVKEVVRTDLPFGTIVTADWSMLDNVSHKIWANHTYNEVQGGLQKVYFIDGRPAAGILTSNSFLMRHESNGSNYHRGRASIIADKLLCSSFAGRDIPITGDVDLTDDDAVAEAVMNQAECVSCHQSVDPLAGHFWGTRARLTPFQIGTAYTQGCDESLPAQFSCYPVPMYASGYDDFWEDLGLREPNYWGSATTDLGDMGTQISEDPRFSLCAAQKFTSYLTQVSEEDLDFRLITKHQQTFIDNNQNAKALALAIVTDPSFLAERSDPEEAAAGLQVVRPEQLHRMILELTGFELRWDIGVSNNGVIPFFHDDTVGFRAMAGGIDGENVIFPTHTPTPIKLLSMAAYAEEAAGYVVDHDFAVPVPDRILFASIDDAQSDESTIREELVSLHMRIYGAPLESTDEAIDDAYMLWSQVQQDFGQTEAWKALLGAMFQSPDILFY